MLHVPGQRPAAAGPPPSLPVPQERLPAATSRAGWAGSSFPGGCSALGRAPCTLLTLTLGWQGQEPLGCLSHLCLSALAHAVPAPGAASPGPCGVPSQRPHGMPLSGYARSPRRSGSLPPAPTCSAEPVSSGRPRLTPPSTVPSSHGSVSPSGSCHGSWLGFGVSFLPGRHWAPTLVKPASRPGLRTGSL